MSQPWYVDIDSMSMLEFYETSLFHLDIEVKKFKNQFVTVRCTFSSQFDSVCI